MPIKKIKTNKKTTPWCTKITTIKQLINSITKGKTEYFISLAGGIIKSSKDINYNPKTKKFWIMNNIDGTTQTLTHKQLMDQKWTNIGLSIKNNGFYRDNR